MISHFFTKNVGSKQANGGLWLPLGAFEGYLSPSSRVRQNCNNFLRDCNGKSRHYLRASALICGFILLSILFSACNTPLKKVDANAWAADYYKYNSGQNRACDLIKLKGKSMTLNLTGVDELTVSSQLPQVSIIPREASFWENFKPTELLLGYGLLRGLQQGPTIVQQPQPLVVEPTVIQK